MALNYNKGDLISCTYLYGDNDLGNFSNFSITDFDAKVADKHTDTEPLLVSSGLFQDTGEAVISYEGKLIRNKLFTFNMQEKNGVFESCLIDFSSKLTSIIDMNLTKISDGNFTISSYPKTASAEVEFNYGLSPFLKFDSFHFNTNLYSNILLYLTFKDDSYFDLKGNRVTNFNCNFVSGNVSKQAVDLSNSVLEYGASSFKNEFLSFLLYIGDIEETHFLSIVYMGHNLDFVVSGKTFKVYEGDTLLGEFEKLLLNAWHRISIRFLGSLLCIDFGDICELTLEVEFNLSQTLDSFKFENHNGAILKLEDIFLSDSVPFGTGFSNTEKSIVDILYKDVGFLIKVNETNYTLSINKEELVEFIQGMDIIHFHDFLLFASPSAINFGVEGFNVILFLNEGPFKELPEVYSLDIVREGNFKKFNFIYLGKNVLGEDKFIADRVIREDLSFLDYQNFNLVFGDSFDLNCDNFNINLRIPEKTDLNYLTANSVLLPSSDLLLSDSEISDKYSYLSNGEVVNSSDTGKKLGLLPKITFNSKEGSLFYVDGIYTDFYKDVGFVDVNLSSPKNTTSFIRDNFNYYFTENNVDLSRISYVLKYFNIFELAFNSTSTFQRVTNQYPKFNFKLATTFSDNVYYRLEFEGENIFEGKVTEENYNLEYHSTLQFGESKFILYVKSGNIEIKIHEFLVYKMAYTLLQPKVVYFNNVTLEYTKYTFSSDVVISNPKIIRESSEGNMEFPILLASSKFTDSSIKEGVSYNYYVSYDIGGKSYRTENLLCNVFVPTVGYISKFNYFENKYDNIMVEGISYQTIDGKNFYTSPDPIIITPLDFGTLIGGKDSDIKYFKVYNSFAAPVNLKLYAVFNGEEAKLFDDGVVRIEDAIKRKDMTQVSILDEKGEKIDYPFIFSLNSEESKIFGFKVKPQVVYPQWEVILNLRCRILQ